MRNVLNLQEEYLDGTQMTEIKDHIAYKLLETKYERICLDYVILSLDGDYEGVQTHKRAVIEAFAILKKRFELDDCYLDMNVDPDKMLSAESSIDELLELPPDSFTGRIPKGEGNYSAPTPIPYWYAFLEPPFAVKYTAADFDDFNNNLFPNRDGMKVYRWNDDFSDYFEAGKEWWGTGLWTAFDENTKVMVVIGASLTD